MNANAWRTTMTRIVVVALLLAVAAAAGAAGTAAQATPTLKIVSPQTGASIATNDLLVMVDVSNFTLDCAQSGRPDQDGVGQVLAFLDGATVAQLTNIYCTDNFIVPLDGLSVGQHQLAVVLASNTHVPMMETAQQITFDYQPVQAIPLPAAHYTGAPAIILASPQDGATVPPVFAVQVLPTNFSPVTALEGRANVPGYGHYHVWVDAPAQHTSLANLVLMPGTNGFTLDLSAWGPGQHTILIEPAQNDHTMYDPETPVTFTVTVSANATPSAATPGASASQPASLAAALTTGAQLPASGVSAAIVPEAGLAR